MVYKCKICGVNDVDEMGDVCESCALGQDPYAIKSSSSQGGATNNKNNIINTNQSDSSVDYHQKGPKRKVLLGGGASIAKQESYSNDMTITDTQSSVQVYKNGKVPQVKQNEDTLEGKNASRSKASKPITSGITKNVASDDEKKSILVKWFRALFYGIPFTVYDDVTTFQVFPDFTSHPLNAQGNACDQVFVYGKINSGVVSENNDVEVYGHRDSNNNVIATTIKNTASGTTIKPIGSMGQGMVWFITAIIVVLLAMFVLSAGVEGIVWIVVLLLCLTNLPLVFKLFSAVIGALISFIRRL